MIARYAGTDLRISTNAGTFTQGDTLVFDDGAAALGRPSTRDILFCDGKLPAPNDGLTALWRRCWARRTTAQRS